MFELLTVSTGFFKNYNLPFLMFHCSSNKKELWMSPISFYKQPCLTEVAKSWDTCMSLSVTAPLHMAGANLLQP